MVFVITYDRASGHSNIERFDDDAMQEAQDRRYQLEVEAAGSSAHTREIAVLKADSESDLRKTHAKYFGLDALRENVADLTR